MSKIPGMVTWRSMQIDGTEFEEYCLRVNRVVKKMALSEGAGYDGTYVFQDGAVRLTYIDSPYGNDQYRVEINCSVWNDIPNGINPFMVNEGGSWNYVYGFQAGRDVLKFHLPGSWVDRLAYYG